MKFDLLAIGDSSIDEFMKVDDASVVCDIDHKNCKICFDYADKIPVESYNATLAGNAPNVVTACKLLGLESTIYTQLGNDSNGERFITEFKKLGIDTTYCIKNSGKPTNVHSIIVFKGERTIFSYHEHFEYKVIDWSTPLWIYYSSLPENFESFQANLVEYLKKNENVLLAFNPGTYHLKAGIEKIKNILELTDVLFVNLEEAQKILSKNENDLEKLHKELQRLGPKLTVITDGENGSSASSGNEVVYAKIYDDGKKLIDKTGAGDAFASAFLSALFYNCRETGISSNHICELVVDDKKSLKEALNWGAINSCGVTRYIGSTAGLKTKKEIEEIVIKGNEFTIFNL